VESPPYSSAVDPSSTLFVLAIGVSKYRAADLNLRFADADARAIAETIGAAEAGRLYGKVRVKVLTNEEVSRESILDNMESFLGAAGPGDVTALFLAGHGVQDLASGSYYFLPHPATVDNLVTEGLRMTDFDAMLGVLRRNVRAVVVMLDTCHAGAFGLPSSRIVAAGEMAAQMSVGDGFFLLAATKPGEESKEKGELGHGAFTYALLEAVRGAADVDHDGVVSASELFAYVARRVPTLTEGRQHPYHRMEGTDLLFLAVQDGEPGTVAQSLPTVSRLPTQAAAESASNVVGVMSFQDLRRDDQYAWISQALRVAFNTELSKVKALRVYSPDLIDHTARARGADQLFTARQLGIGRLFTGSFHVTDNTLRIDASIVNVSSGVNEASDSVEGELDEFFDLQKELVLSMLRRLRVQVSPEEGASIQTRTNTDVDAYRLLLEAEGVVGTTPETSPTQSSRPNDEPRSELESSPLSRWWSRFASVARAAETPPTTGAATLDEEVRAVLEEYRQALQDKAIDRVAALYASFSARQRDALRGYLEAATDLAVELADVTVTPHGMDVMVAFTRRDSFTDRESEKPVRLEVRLTKTLVRLDGDWKIASGQ
jgi:TolB-like protein